MSSVEILQIVGAISGAIIAISISVLMSGHSQEL